jgi:hypothetical protein
MSKDRKGLQFREASGNVIIVQTLPTTPAGKPRDARKAVYEPVSGDVTSPHGPQSNMISTCKSLPSREL